MLEMASLGIGEKFICVLFLIYVVTKFLGTYSAFAVVLIGGSLQLFIWHRKVTLWKRLGLPSPPAWILLGNMVDYGRKGMHNCDVEWTQKYGKLFGAYLFTMPEVIVSDKELLKRVLVKDFHHFSNRREIFSVASEESVFSKFLVVARDDYWKNTRNAITPAFTSGKLKNTVHLMEKRIQTFLEILEEQQGTNDGVDVKNVMTNLALEVIAAAAFAMDTDAQRNPDNQFSKYCKMLTGFSFTDWRLQLSMIFPWLTAKLDEYFGIKVLAIGGAEDFYVDSLAKAIRERRQNPKTDKLDFLQLMINAADSKGDRSEVDTDIDFGIAPSKPWTMSDFDIIAQSFLFLLAGQETTSNTLAYAAYLLAVHPEVQEKAFEEIIGLTPNGEAITYDHVQHHLPYLEAVIMETLRLYPAAIRLDRECQDDYRLTDELTIPKGAGAVVPVYALHHSAENYEEPEKFIPERFPQGSKSDVDPFTYMPFGYGPRNCIGMRFAQLEMKMILSNLIRDFKIAPASDTQLMPLEAEFTASGLKPKKPIRLLFHKRRAN